MNLVKKGVTYTRKEDGTLYAGPLSQSGKVGGTGEAQRNAVHNPTRLERILEINQTPRVLDYGCGSGLLVDFLNTQGVATHGYDKYNPEYITTIPKNFYDVVTMVEVVEHLCEPYSELDEVFSCLTPGGAVMIETSFTDFVNDDDDYINPDIGHSTIFSHKGLDDLMAEKGFKVGSHINRNVRVYTKPGVSKTAAPKKKGITLITMGQGNPIALKRTLESFKGVCNEVVFGDLLIFEKDRELIYSYCREYNMSIANFPFNFIFENGFANTLNTMANSPFVTNDFVLYMNVGEVIDGEFDILGKINHDFNAYYLDHATETHHWYRLYNRRQLQWGGMIHEEIVGNRRPYPSPIFRFADTEKDMQSEFYAKVMNDVKEMVYFNQYIKLVEQPDQIGITNNGWVEYAKDGYESLKERITKKGKRYEAFKEDNLPKFMEDIFTNPEFEKERHESNDMINFQGARKDIL